MCVHMHVCTCMYPYIRMSYICHTCPFWSWRLCTVPCISLIITISGTISLGASKQLLWSVIAPGLTVLRPCLEGTGRQLPQWKPCDYFGTPNCPKAQGFRPRRNAIALSARKTRPRLRFLQDWLRPIAPAEKSVPCMHWLWSLNLTEKKHSLHVLLIAQRGRPCSSCNRIQFIMLPSVVLLW